MAQWYVKDLSKLTQVTAQTLHHYDRIGLLKPSVRLPNGYRLYSEKDLLKLQQIIALKFFGFELAQIKTLLYEEVNVVDHFSVQSQFLEEKAKSLLDASKALKSIISDCRRDKSVPWKTIIKLIEVYRMTQNLEKTWIGKVLTPTELKEYAQFSQGLKTRFTAEEKQAYEKEWADIVSQINENLDQNPGSAVGIALGRRCMNWVNSVYSPKHAGLRKAVWEKGFKGGQGGSEHGLPPQSVAWLDRAIDAYYKDRIFKIMDQAGKQADEVVFKSWEALLVDMYGDQQELKNEFFHAVIKDEKISQTAKDWLKKFHKQ